MNRRTFTYLSLSGIVSGFGSSVGFTGCDRPKQKMNYSDAFLADKLRGMILLGAYGDALGALHEPAGLQGKVGLPEQARQLSTVGSYQPPGQEGSPWWVWVDGASHLSSMKGLPTDDSAFRLFILQPWVNSLSGDIPSEALFTNWLKKQARFAVDPIEGSWELNRLRQINDWIVMLNDASRWNTLSASGMKASAFKSAPENPFFRADIPVVFGLFMYLELAALYAFCSPPVRIRHFSTFSSLDQGYAGAVTGLYAGLIGSALINQPGDSSFSTWYASSISELLHSSPLSAEDTNLLQSSFVFSWEWGLSQQVQSETDFLVAFKQNIYNAPLPGSREQLGFRVFDPLLFFRQMTAVLAYTDGNITKALSLLASSPGDADTVPSMLGTLAGAWYGFDALQSTPIGTSGDLEHVSSTISTLFDYDLESNLSSMVSFIRSQNCSTL